MAEVATNGSGPSSQDPTLPDLDGKTIVVAGGTGDVGVGIVVALTELGAEVVVPVRSIAKVDALRTELRQPDRLTAIEGFPTDEAGVTRLRDALAKIGPIDATVASLGSWVQHGTLMDLDVDTLRSAADGLLFSHVLFARAVLPNLRLGSSYIAINGAAAEDPVPGSAVVSVMTSGLAMLVRAIAAEHPTIHVHTLLLRSVIATRTRDRHDPSWVTPEEVGRFAATLLTPTGRLTAGSTISLNPKPSVAAASEETTQGN